MKYTEELEQSFYDIDKTAMEALDKKWPLKEVYRALGISRETLRYYEKLELIEPLREENSYRSFNMNMMQNLLRIDYYKKRGFRSSELPRMLVETNLETIQQQFLQKQEELKEKMRELQSTLNRVEEDIALLNQLPEASFQLSIKEFPLYRVLDQLPDATDFELYDQHFLRHVDVKKQDMYGCMIREVQVDEEHGYQTSVLHIVERAEERLEHGVYLHSGPCVYTIVETNGMEEASQIMKKMFTLGAEYLKDHKLRMIGSVYIMNRIAFSKDTQNFVCYHESYIPLLEKVTKED